MLQQIEAGQQGASDLEEDLRLNAEELASARQAQADLEQRLQRTLQELEAGRQGKADLEEQLRLNAEELNSARQAQADLEERLQLTLQELGTGARASPTWKSNCD